MHVVWLQNGAAGLVTACLCLLSMRVIGSYMMYIVLNSKYSGFQHYSWPQKVTGHVTMPCLSHVSVYFLWPQVYPKNFAFAVHDSAHLRNFSDYIIRYILISTFRFGSGNGERAEPDQAKVCQH